MANNIIYEEATNKIDKKKKLKRIVIGAFVFIITVLVGLILFYKYTLYQAEKNFNMDKYPEAKQYYQTAFKLNLGIDWDIKNKIQSCDELQSEYYGFREPLFQMSLSHLSGKNDPLLRTESHPNFLEFVESVGKFF
ncbi:hypothetical protein [Desulfitobacterium metallireducens]|uniref:Uncharacterized protein n=1 Tax=Desulfitobacterium metallireducens DSM 15288 TaxID=871968 RepID=W0EC72_9FIRM|nr:hypothetical protein [Desulfitobacterium metallireducens]AHF08357.1 hypothetical protein DESME_00555 [Desulfitobacterium metallireducens DSM 15288]